jgi:hypothetical protein
MSAGAASIPRVALAKKHLSLLRVGASATPPSLSSRAPGRGRRAAFSPTISSSRFSGGAAQRRSGALKWQAQRAAQREWARVAFAPPRTTASTTSTSRPTRSLTPPPRSRSSTSRRALPTRPGQATAPPLRVPHLRHTQGCPPATQGCAAPRQPRRPPCRPTQGCAAPRQPRRPPLACRPARLRTLTAGAPPSPATLAPRLSRRDSRAATLAPRLSRRDSRAATLAPLSARPSMTCSTSPDASRMDLLDSMPSVIWCDSQAAIPSSTVLSSTQRAATRATQQFASCTHVRLSTTARSRSDTCTRATTAPTS